MKRMIFGLMIGLHKDDPEMVEIYTVRNGRKVLWCVAHVEMLSELPHSTEQDLRDSGPHELVSILSSRSKGVKMVDV